MLRFEQITRDTLQLALSRCISIVLSLDLLMLLTTMLLTTYYYYYCYCLIIIELLFVNDIILAIPFSSFQVSDITAPYF